MQVISTNIAEPKTILWRGKKVQTGIYKKPVAVPIHLDKEDVKGDHVIDRRYHGGIDKACYIYALNHYPYWKEKYPDLDWEYGMFGENLTVKGFDEHKVRIGSIYKIGTATVQISRPRQPCYKLGVRFGTQKILKEFIDTLLSGVYLRIVEAGKVQIDDVFELIEENQNGISVAQLNTLIFHFDKEKHTDLLESALQDPLVSDSDKKYFAKKIKG